MKYPNSLKIKGEDGFNGFELTYGKVYLTYRLNLISNAIYQVITNNLKSYHFKVSDSEIGSSGSEVAEKYRKLYQKKCVYLDCISEDGDYELFFFCRSNLLEVETILNDVYSNYNLIAEYNLNNDDEQITLLNSCFRFCEDNESNTINKKYLKSSQFSAQERLWHVYRVPKIVLKKVA